MNSISASLAGTWKVGGWKRSDTESPHIVDVRPLSTRRKAARQPEVSGDEDRAASSSARPRRHLDRRRDGSPSLQQPPGEDAAEQVDRDVQQHEDVRQVEGEEQPGDERPGRVRHGACRGEQRRGSCRPCPRVRPRRPSGSGPARTSSRRGRRTRTRRRRSCPASSRCGEQRDLEQQPGGGPDRRRRRSAAPRRCASW